MGDLISDRSTLLQLMNNAAGDSYACDISKLKKFIIEPIQNDNNKHFLSFSQDDNTQISYADKLQYIYDNQHRKKTTLARYIRRQLKVDCNQLSDSAIDFFCNYIFTSKITEEDIDKDIVYLSGKDICDFYVKNHTTIGSCMSYKEEQTELYSLNPDKVQLVVYKNQTRCLLWTCDCGTKVLDRFYPSGHKFKPIMKKWAQLKNYVYREECFDCLTADFYDNTSEACTISLSSGKKYVVTLTCGKFFPYLDTFQFGYFVDYNKIKLSNSSKCNRKTFGLRFDDTDGKYFLTSQFCKLAGNGYYCDKCKNLVKDTEFIEDDCDYICKKCMKNE